MLPGQSSQPPTSLVGLSNCRMRFGTNISGRQFRVSFSHFPSRFTALDGLSVNPGSSSRLTAALAAPNASYDGSEVITAYGVEARNENAL